MSAERLSNKDKWVVLKSLFDEKGLVRQHLDSYNIFIQDEMQNIVDESNEVVPDIPNEVIRRIKKAAGTNQQIKFLFAGQQINSKDEYKDLHSGKIDRKQEVITADYRRLYQISILTS